MYLYPNPLDIKDISLMSTLTMNGAVDHMNVLEV